jgi:hypothetical protein
MLIHTFSPFPDESGRGYYRRLSSANVMGSWKDLAHHCGARASHDALLAHPQHVATRLGLEPQWCEQATAQDNIARSWTGLNRHGRDAVCTLCLRESAHLRSIWEHAFLVACPRHGVLLRDECSSCGAQLRDTREHICACDCGFDLRAAPAEPATPAQRWLSSLLDGGTGAVEGCGPAMPATDVSVASKLIRTLCRQPDARVKARRGNAAAPSTMHALVAYLLPLEQFLGHWPANFELHVSERLLQGPAEARTLNSRLGAWYQQLRKLSAHEASHPFLSAIGHVAQREFDGVLGMDGAAAVVNQKASHVLLLEAARRIGIAHSALLNYRRKGALQCQAIKAGTNGFVYQVAVEEVNAIIEARQMWLSEELACDKLGVPPAVLGHLCDAGVVVREAKWKSDLRKAGPIGLASLQRLVQAVHLHDTRSVHDGLQRMKLCELTARHVGDKKALGTALRAIASGAIRALQVAEPIGQSEFLCDDIAAHYARPMLESGMTIQQLSQVTGYKHESIVHWVRLGLLRSQQVDLRGQPCRIVMPEQLAQFRREFVPLSDLAAEMGTKSSALAQQLGTIAIVGCQTLAGGVRRGGLVRMADLARAAMGQGARARAAAPAEDAFNTTPASRTVCAAPA